MEPTLTSCSADMGHRKESKVPQVVTYAEFVAGLVKPGEQILVSLTPQQAHLIHMVMGIVGEAGELMDAIKKNTIYQKPLDMENVVEELGDIEFYSEGMRQGLNIERHDVISANMAKLSKRYASGRYSDAQAQARADKVCNDNGCRLDKSNQDIEKD